MKKNQWVIGHVQTPRGKMSSDDQARNMRYKCDAIHFCFENLSSDRWFKESRKSNRKQGVILRIGQRLQKWARQSRVIERREALHSNNLLKLSICVHCGVQATRNQQRCAQQRTASNLWRNQCVITAVTLVSHRAYA